MDILRTRRQPSYVFIEHLWKRFWSEWAVKVICSLTVQSQISEENRFLFLAQKSTTTHILTFMLNYGVGSAWKLKISFWHIDCWAGVQPFTIISFNHSLIKFSKERYILLLLSILYYFPSFIHHTTRELNLMFILQNNQSFQSHRSLFSGVSKKKRQPFSL